MPHTKKYHASHTDIVKYRMIYLDYTWWEGLAAEKFHEFGKSLMICIWKKINLICGIFYKSPYFVCKDTFCSDKCQTNIQNNTYYTCLLV